jgi:integrase
MLGVNTQYVFTWKGKPIKHTITRALRGILRKAGLERVTLHMLRHTFASHLVMAGVPLMDVQELMGHQDFDTTLRYAHLSPDHVKRQVLHLPYANSGASSEEALVRNWTESSLFSEKPKKTKNPRSLTATGI